MLDSFTTKHKTKHFDVNDQQPTPVRNDLPAVWDLVIEDMRRRDADGFTKYKMRLQPHNGRNALIDKYQEQLDDVAYTRQLIYELEHPKPNYLLVSGHIACSEKEWAMSIMLQSLSTESDLLLSKKDPHLDVLISDLFREMSSLGVARNEPARAQLHYSFTSTDVADKFSDTLLSSVANLDCFLLVRSAGEASASGGSDD